MQNPLFWIEWLDRLDRVLKSARQDVAALKRALSPRTLQAIDRSKRQLAALINDLRLLDRDVVAVGARQSGADSLQATLERTVAQLGSLVEIPAASAAGKRCRASRQPVRSRHAADAASPPRVSGTAHSHQARVLGPRKYQRIK